MSSLNLHGECAEDFAPLKDTFIANFEELGEVGARVTVYQGDAKVVDLWGGFVDEARTVPWREDTLVCTMSVSKGVAALAAHMLADQGLLNYDAPVAHYWPEFGQAGKEDITVRQLMSHQASLQLIDNVEHGDIFDFDGYTSKIAKQAPNWPPGTNRSYHSVTIGFMVGTLVKRIDGRAIEKFIRDEITEPLNADYFLGASDTVLKRVAPMLPNPENAMLNGGVINEETADVFKAYPDDPDFFTSEAFYRSVIPSGSGVSNANGIARIFAPLANDGMFCGRRYFQPSTVKAMSEVQWHEKDYLFDSMDFRTTMGLLRSCDTFYHGRDQNVGSAGAGGHTVFADPLAHLTFAYTPVRATTGSGNGLESVRLVDAMYECV